MRTLIAKRSQRDAEGVCVVEGVRSVSAALAAGVQVETVYATPGADEHAALLDRVRATGAAIKWMTPEAMDRVADTVNPQSVMAVVRVPRRRVHDLAEVSLVVVLADVSDPGNAGTIVRAAQGAGASAVVFCRGSVDAFSPKTVRSSAGALFQVPVLQGAEAGEVLDVLAQRGVRRLGTAAAGGEPYDTVGWDRPTALVLGNEAWGVPAEVASRVDGWVTIPMAGSAESLNVAMAASVLLFEAARQRRRSS